MANDKNVDLLALHLDYALGLHPRRNDESQGDWCRRLAAWMIETSPHVLVPSALTDEQAFDLARTGDPNAPKSSERELIEAKLIRSRLEHIAKGES